jgi:hypothetical protein
MKNKRQRSSLASAERDNACSAGVAPFVWECAMYDAAWLFGEFGVELERLGWQPVDLFMAHGLVWLLKGTLRSVGHGMLGDRCDFQEGGEVLIGRSRSIAPTLRLQRRSGFRGL